MSVHQQRFLQVHKFRERKVSGHGRLTALFSQYPDPHVRLLYHRDIVTAVADGSGMRAVSCGFYQIYNLYTYRQISYIFSFIQFHLVHSVIKCFI